MTFAIRADGIGKLYSINRASKHPSSLREMISERLKVFKNRNRPTEVIGCGPEDTEKSEFWALKDVSFEIAQGERIGIIGANGAGKSTLLKILSRVTAPTCGRVDLKGKVASLLEVGTGFHPELTGRENIYLNGAILGMPRAEIGRKFDEIVDFSGVEKFIDTPVKHYSSGMYVRLAFSVSAWLDPDILILDEVLSVGDYGFQKKCEMRMRELTREGRTVLFVSHSMAAVNQMCQKALYLDQGRLVSFGSVIDATEEYENDVIEASGIVTVEPRERSISNPAERGGSHEARVSFVSVNGKVPGTELPAIQIGKSLNVIVRFEILQDLPANRPLDIALGIDAQNGSRIFTTVSSWEGKSYSPSRGEYTAEIVIETILLRPGEYLLNFALICGDITVDSLVHCGAFVVEGGREIGGIPWRYELGSARFPVLYSGDSVQND